MTQAMNIRAGALPCCQNPCGTYCPLPGVGAAATLKSLSPSCFPQDWDLMLPDGCGENGVMGEMLGAAAVGQTYQRQI